jgi:hypothetical protein
VKRAGNQQLAGGTTAGGAGSWKPILAKGLRGETRKNQQVFNSQSTKNQQPFNNLF